MHSGPVVVLGATGLFGFALQHSRPAAIPVCNRHNSLAQCRDWVRADLEDTPSIRQIFDELKPSLVVHAAGICDVDRCEEDPTWAWDINVGGTEGLLNALDPSVNLVYISSDHVFGAGGEGPLFEDTKPNPISVYGETRVACEEMILNQRPNSLCIRAPLLIGPSLNGRSGHRDWLRYRAKQGLPLTVIADECRHAVWLSEAAEWAWKAMDLGITGIRHISGTGPVFRPDLARNLMAADGIQVPLTIETRAQQAAPHLGRIDLRSKFADQAGLELPLGGP